MLFLKWLLFEEIIDFVIIKLAFKGLNKKKPTSPSSPLTLIHENENIKSVYLEEMKETKKLKKQI